MRQHLLALPPPQVLFQGFFNIPDLVLVPREAQHLDSFGVEGFRDWGHTPDTSYTLHSVLIWDLIDLVSRGAEHLRLFSYIRIYSVIYDSG